MGAPRKYDYPSDDTLLEAAREEVSKAALARRFGIRPDTFRHYLREQPDLNAKLDARLAHTQMSASRAAQRDRISHLNAAPDAGAELDAEVRRLLGNTRRDWTVDALADELDLAPRHVRDALDRLRDAGYRVPEEQQPGAVVELQKVPPQKLNLHKSLLDGHELTVGVVSDTHLASNEEALEQLHLAYDHFAEVGVREVWHAGDLVAGRGIFRTQDAEVRCNTFERQVDYAVEHYPRRDQITTRMIAGNHDIEGDFGRMGADPVRAVANRRDDIDYLGAFEAWVELPGGSFVHLLHGKGGMSYSVSYKAQKLVDGYPGGRKPAALICGHYHVRGDFEARGVQVLFPGCFEWRTPLLARLGLNPAVGFHVLRLTVGDDGSIVRWRPEWIRFWEGRVIAAAKAA